MIFKEFFGRYKAMVPKKESLAMAALASDDAKVKALLPLLQKALNVKFKDSDVLLGKTKVFAKAHIQKTLEDARPMFFSTQVLMIQRIYRGYKARKMLGTARKLGAWMKKFKASGCTSAIQWLKTTQAVEEELKKLDKLIQDTEKQSKTLPMLPQAHQVRAKMEKELKVIEDLQKLANSTDVTKLEQAIARAANVGITDGADIEKLKARIAKLEDQVALVIAMEQAIKDEDADKLKNCYQEVKSKGLASSPENWVEGHRELEHIIEGGNAETILVLCSSLSLG
jgi:myosin heavy subunit